MWSEMMGGLDFAAQCLLFAGGFTYVVKSWKHKGEGAEPSLDDYCRHVFMQGLSGVGKSTFVSNIIHNLSSEVGITFLTVKKDDVNKIASCLRPEDTDRAYIIRPNDKRMVVGLNPFLRKRWDSSERDFITGGFLNSLRVAGMLPSGASIIVDAITCALTCLLIATEKDGSRKQVTPIDLTRTFEDDKYRQWVIDRAYPVNPILADGLKQYKGDDRELRPTMRRLRTFFAQETLQAMMCQETGFDFDKALDEKWLSFWDLSDSSGCGDFLASVVLSKFKAAALSRSENADSYHMLIADEAQNYVTDDIQRLVAEARSRKVSLWLICQSGEAQLTTVQKGRILSTMAMCQSQIFFKLSTEDSPKAAKTVKGGGYTDQDLQNLPERWIIAKMLINRKTVFWKKRCPPPPPTSKETLAYIVSNTKHISAYRGQVLELVRRTYTATPGTVESPQPRGRSLWVSDSKNET